MPDKSNENEFSRLVEVEKVAPQGHVATLRAEPDECRAVAKRLGLLALDSLTATLTVRRLADGVSYGVKGVFDAAVVQECVVSLTPLPSKLHDDVGGLFVPAKHLADDDGAEIDDPLADAPEPIKDGAIDLGELVVQHLALGLDPYPRLAGVEPALPRSVAADKDTRKPFSDLATLLKSKEKTNEKE